MADNDNPAGEALLHWREQLLKGESIYGDPNSHIAKEKLAEYEARIALARELGELPPPIDYNQKVREERFASMHPGADPSLVIVPEHLVESHAARVAALVVLDDRTLAARADDLSKDLQYNPNQYTIRYSMYDRELGRNPSGHEIRKAMLADAETALAQMHLSAEDMAKTRKALGVDRSLLENFAHKGAHIAQYKADHARIFAGKK